MVLKVLALCSIIIIVGGGFLAGVIAITNGIETMIKQQER